MPGKHISSFEELLQFADEIHLNEDAFAKDRETLNKQINGRYLDKCNCESFVSWMLTK